MRIDERTIDAAWRDLHERLERRRRAMCGDTMAGRTYRVDGRDVNGSDLVTDNADDPSIVTAVIAMRVGDLRAFGGGAAAETLIERIA